MTDLPLPAFAEFNLPEKLKHSLERINFTNATPIQAQAIPLALEGCDILGSAQTGTGKTGAFAIPLVAKLMEDPRCCALVMTPTRELAAQVVEQIQQMIPTQHLKTALLIGGEAMPKQFKQLQMRPRIVVGTPGRINDHLMRQTLDLRYTKFLVLDETDRMLDMGFGIQIDKIIAYMPKEDRQTLMFSATLPSGIVKMSAKYLRNPVRIAVGSTTTPAAKIKQEVIHTPDKDKYTHLLQQIDQRDGSIIIFVRTKHGADRMAEKLEKLDHRVNALHGDLQQRKRDRVIQNFRDKKIRILVATDVAARGLDIPHIEHVINYDLPQVPEDYIHRIGRTARAGAEGAALNLVSPSENGKWKAIQRLVNDGQSDEESFREDGRKPASRSSKKPFGKKDYGDQKPFARKDMDRRSFGRNDFAGEGRRENRFDSRPNNRQDNRQDNGWGNRADNRTENRSSKPQRRFSEDRFENMFDDRPAPAERPFGGFGKGRAKPATGGPKRSFGGKPAAKGGFKKRFEGGPAKPKRFATKAR